MTLSDNLENGNYDTSRNLEYKYRMIPTINAILPELYKYSDTRSVTAGDKPVPTFVESLGDAVDLDDTLARAVLPHAVISLLFADENRTLANFHEQKYREKLAELAQTPQEFSAIEDSYGITDYSYGAEE